MIKKKEPISSEIILSPKIANSTKIRSPKTIPAETAAPFGIPSVAERVTTNATLVLGIMARATITTTIENTSYWLMFIKFSVRGM